MEKYLAVIRVLENGDSITQQQIMRKTELNLISLKECFNFLVKFDLIREKIIGSKKMYSITVKGQRICGYFGLNDDNSIFDGTGIFRID
jgi:predicted transcriptional regulator